MSQSCFSLKILSTSSLHFVGIRVFIIGCIRNAKSQLQPNIAFWRLDLATRTSRKFESWANCLARLEVLSCSAITGVTLQLSLHASHVCHSGNLLVGASREIQSRGFSWVHTSWAFFTFFYTLPLHNSHLNTGYLIAKLQANLARNKTNI